MRRWRRLSARARLATVGEGLRPEDPAPQPGCPLLALADAPRGGVGGRWRTRMDVASDSFSAFCRSWKLREAHESAKATYGKTAPLRRGLPSYRRSVPAWWDAEPETLQAAQMQHQAWGRVDRARRKLLGSFYNRLFTGELICRARRGLPGRTLAQCPGRRLEVAAGRELEGRQAQGVGFEPQAVLGRSGRRSRQPCRIRPFYWFLHEAVAGSETKERTQWARRFGETAEELKRGRKNR